MDKETLIQTVCSVQQGDESAITELYNAYYNDIYYYILKTLDKEHDPDLAADLTQDTFIEIIQTIGNLQEPVTFPAWSRKVAYHRCTAYFRKRHELLADEQEDGSTIFDTIPEDREEFIPGEALDKEVLKNAIQEMIDSLPEEQRSAIMMRYFDELSVQEIAQIQGTTEGTVKSRLNYGRKSIKQAVENFEKKNDIRLHCTGIIPLLLWLFRMQRRTTGMGFAAGVSGSASVAGSASASGSASGVAGTVKTAVGATAKMAATKIVAIVTAATVAVGAIGVGIAQLVKPSEPAPGTTTEPGISQTQPNNSSVVTNLDPEAYLDTWINGKDTLTITFPQVLERYYLEYRPAEGTAFDFFCEFDSAGGQLYTSFGNSCGVISDNGSIRWEETGKNWELRVNGDTLIWQMDESDNNQVLTFHREGTPDPANTFALEDFPAYIQKLEEYRAAIYTGSYSEENYPSLNNAILSFYHHFGESYDFCYALTDIDGNGVPELLVGKDRSPFDIYSLNGDQVVQYFSQRDFFAEMYMSIDGDGIITISGSYNASSGGTSVYQISEDGTSVISLAHYTYYFPDEESIPPDGDFMSYEDYRAALAQYPSYSGEIQWISLEP